MIIEWVFAGITLTAVLMATFVSNMRRAILALWVAGLGVGAMYLTIGVEFLAIVQWIVSTLVTISFIFFAVMFGEYNPPPSQEKENRYLLTFLALLIGGAFATIIWYGAQDLPDTAVISHATVSDLKIVGKTLTQDHLLSLEVLALTLFLVLVGGGVVARSEGGDQ